MCVAVLCVWLFCVLVRLTVHVCVCVHVWGVCMCVVCVCGVCMCVVCAKDCYNVGVDHPEWRGEWYFLSEMSKHTGRVTVPLVIAI